MFYHGLSNITFTKIYSHEVGYSETSLTILCIRNLQGRQLDSYQRSGFIKFSPARLTAPSQGGSPDDSKSLCGNK